MKGKLSEEKKVQMILGRKVKKILEKNWKEGKSKLGYYAYTSPDLWHYHQWFWDSGFASIVWTKFNVDRAIKEIQTFLQVQEKSGFLPHVIVWKKRFFERIAMPKWWRYEFKTKNYSAEIQPFVFGISLYYVVEALKQKNELEKRKEKLIEIIEKFAKYVEWLYRERDMDGDALISIVTPMESGMDCSPQYELELFGKIRGAREMKLRVDRLLKKYKQLNWKYEKILRLFDVEDLTINSILAYSLFLLGKIENDIKERYGIFKLFKRTKRAIEKKMFDREEEIFFSLGKNEEKLKVKTSACFLPSLVVETSYIKKLIPHLKSEFWTKWPIPSVAIDEPSFGPLTNTRFLWRGTTWINMNWLIYLGIKRLKTKEAKEIANELKKKTRELVLKKGIHEFYDPFTGNIGKAAKNFTWSCLALMF